MMFAIKGASFTPFIEKLDYRSPSKAEISSEEKEFSKSLKTAKKLVFSANSLAIFISLIVIVLLLMAEGINKAATAERMIFNQTIHFRFVFCIFYAALFYLVSLNGILIVRAVHLLSDIVMARIEDGE